MEYLTTDEYAKLFKLHPQHVREMCNAGKLPAVKVGNAWRIPYREPPDAVAEERVMEAVDAIMAPCVAVVDAAIDSLMEMKEALRRASEEGMA